MKQGDPEAPKRVGVWIRVSTEDQVRGESPEHHEHRARAYAEARGWIVVETFRLDAVSGKAVMDHPEAQRMLKAVRSGSITGLVFSKLARLARNTKELLEFAEIFREHRADLVSLHEAIDTSTPAGRLFFTIIAAMAQWEREEIAERVAASVAVRAKLGKPLGGAAPFGYRWQDKQLVPDHNEVPVLGLLFELFAEHGRKKTVARLLNERGYRTRNGSRFSDTTVARLLQDSTAKGLHRANYTRTRDRSRNWELKPETDWVYIPVEAVVSGDLWDRCNGLIEQQRARAKSPGRKSAHLFAGFTYCGCGQKMYVWSNSPKYACPRCRNKMPVVDLEAVYREQLTYFLVSPEEVAQHDEAARETIREKELLIEAAEAELDKLAAQEEQLFQLYYAAKLSADDFGQRHAPLSDRKKQLREELPRLQAALDVLKISLASHTEAVHEANDLASRWTELPFEEKRQIVEAITDRIVVGTDEVEINLLYLPSQNDADRATRPHGFIAATSCTRAG